VQPKLGVDGGRSDDGGRRRWRSGEAGERDREGEERVDLGGERGETWGMSGAGEEERAGDLIPLPTPVNGSDGARPCCDPGRRNREYR